MQTQGPFNPQVTAALIAGIIAAFSAIASIILQITFRILDSRSKKKSYIIEKRQESLLLALNVIDHVYANTPFDNKPAANPHEWDITLSRDAMNKMIIFCKDPDIAVRAFLKAIGLHNPDTQKPSLYGPMHLAEFRAIVCNELELPNSKYTDNDLVWISKLLGAK